MRLAAKRHGSSAMSSSNSLAKEDHASESQRLRSGELESAQGGSNGFSRAGSFSISTEDVVDSATVTRKLNWHLMTRLCLLTVLNHMDRANLAFAAPQMNKVLGFNDKVYGLGSGVFFIGYMVFQIPSQLIAQRVGIAKWLAVILIAWGAVATSFAGLTSSHVHLYVLRFLLGATEAGTFPAMWGLLMHFYAGGPALAAAWAYVGAAQSCAQVIGAPIAALLLSSDGFLGLRGYQWLFVLEGIPTILLGIWIWFTLAPTPGKAKFLTLAEREYASRQVKQNKDLLKKETGELHWTYGLKCWKVYAQGFGSGWAGILRYGAMYWTPLIALAIVYGNSEGGDETASKSATAALLAGIPYTWAAISTWSNGHFAKKTGKMYWLLLSPLLIGSLGLLILAFSLGHVPWIAFLGLIVSATSQASNPIEWSYPATYLHGDALSVGWTVANCISAYGGILGPWIIGSIKQAFGTYVFAMSTLAVVNTCAVVYFAVLLLYLPARREDSQENGSQVASDIEALVPERSERPTQ